MKRFGTRALVVLALAVVLSLGLAAGAMATPSFNAVSPVTASNTASGSFSLIILGNNISEILDVDSVTLYQTGPPYDVIYTSNPQVIALLPNTVITSDLNTYGEHAGTYNVVIAYCTSLGQIIPSTGTLYGAFTVTQPAPPPATPSINSVTPARVTAGAPGFTMTVTGLGFGTFPFEAKVMWNSTALVTTGTMPNPTAILSATVPATLLATPGTASITVVNPNLGGGVVSNAIMFSVETAAPVLTGLAPATTFAKFYQPPVVVLSGSGFLAGSTVVVNGVSRAATFVSSTQLSVQLTAADIATAGSFTIAVSNPAPGGGTSAGLPFTVVADTTAPVTMISGADALWHNAPVTLTVTATDAQSGVQMTQYGIGTVPPWTTLVGTTITVPAPAGGGGDGVKTVSAFSTSKCNIAEAPPVTATVNICTVGPATEAFAPTSVKKGKSLTLGYQADSITPTCTIQFKIFKSNGATAKTLSVGEKASNTQGSYKFTCNLAKGKYKVKVYATDAAGNAQATMNGDSFTVK